MNYEINLADIKDYNTHDPKLNKATAALLIIEMQNAFKGELISPKQIQNVQKLIDFADNNSIKRSLLGIMTVPILLQI